MPNPLSALFTRLFGSTPAEPLCADHRAWVMAEVPFAPDLATDLRDLLFVRMAEFLHSTPFEGCDGLSLTDPMRLHVAAQACRLRLHHPDGRYPDLRRVLIYPDDFNVPLREADPAGIVTEGTEWRSGESWQTGQVVLSWREIEHDLRDARDRRNRAYKPHLYPARNLILHEFAHQMDFSYNLTGGIDPDTGDVTSPSDWNLALADAYVRLDNGMGNRRRPALDDYGAEAPAELFAVAVEAYFETPEELRRQYPKLFAALGEFLADRRP